MRTPKPCFAPEDVHCKKDFNDSDSFLLALLRTNPFLFFWCWVTAFDCANLVFFLRSPGPYRKKPARKRTHLCLRVYPSSAAI